MKNRHFAAVDLGATSGRTILGSLNDEGLLNITEINRFPNKMIHVGDALCWDVYALMENIKDGLAKIASMGIVPESVGIDTWGVDFGCLAPDGSIISLPTAYRDPRLSGAAARYFAKHVPADVHYRRTGIQHMDFNTVFQLDTLRDTFALRNAQTILFMPDLIAYLLTGEKVMEYTIASTGSIIDPATRRLHPEVLATVGLTADKFGRPTEPGTTIGTLTEKIAAETGLPRIPVVAVAGHDTASAVAAVPAENGGFAYISSGTWSLMGIESRTPVVNATTISANITNEGGVDGTIRLLKNVTGMWLAEQCLAAWKRRGTSYTYPQMVELALAARENVCRIDPDAPDFVAPDDMPAAITAYCEATGQTAPATDGEFLRCIFESLAAKYADVLDTFRKLSADEIRTIHVIGGGSRNHLLNQFTADATGLTVTAGPAEATAIGNIMLQARAAGAAGSLAEMRQIIARNTELTTYTPSKTTK